MPRLMISGPVGRMMASSMRASVRDHARKRSRSTGGHAEHLADHDDGQRIGEVRQDVHGARGLDGIEQVAHDLLDVRRICSTTRGVKALLTRVRSLV